MGARERQCLPSLAPLFAITWWNASLAIETWISSSSETCGQQSECVSRRPRPAVAPRARRERWGYPLVLNRGADGSLSGPGYVRRFSAVTFCDSRIRLVLLLELARVNALITGCRRSGGIRKAPWPQECGTLCCASHPESRMHPRLDRDRHLDSCLLVRSLARTVVAAWTVHGFCRWMLCCQAALRAGWPTNSCLCYPLLSCHESGSGHDPWPTASPACGCINCMLSFICLGAACRGSTENRSGSESKMGARRG